MGSRSCNPVLPVKVARFFEAANAGDVAGLLRVFAPDSIVNDQLQEWRGLTAIRRWAECDVVGQQLSLRVVHWIEHYGHCIVTAEVDGNFDKRGLPDPLEVHLYFTFAEDKVVQLVMLRDLSGTARLDDLLRGSR
ncbi:nuclear transport factor 2 family protein [Steroidobacter sp. S1-65]|uniref:Nuclear transport factor 2 family protein n=1 Tax=Steroidobacter gossypii TaxID=2805490 RepID=A0ABS1X5R9_9GAMM|nr:nuclear transport factor 2 family protein [Steroidobacter gossypii]MBM0108561.1 nuclear transport factor 2 family protein [Steroidobacter gossypii]